MVSTREGEYGLVPHPKAPSAARPQNVRSPRPRGQVRAAGTARGKSRHSRREGGNRRAPRPKGWGFGGQPGRWPPDKWAAGPAAPGPMPSPMRGRGMPGETAAAEEVGAGPCPPRQSARRQV